MFEVDVLIVGGGPAGASLGYMLQKNGFRSCIIDKNHFPRKKLCGGLLTKKTVDILYDIYQKTEFPYERVSTNVNLFLGTDLISNAHTKAEFYLVERYDFDYYLVNEYSLNGGKIFESLKVQTFDFDAGIATLIDDTKIKFKIVVGADGANSQVRKYLDKKYKPNAMCLETSCNSDDITDCINIYFSTLRSGYGWCFPKKDHYTIGIGGEIQKNEDIRKAFDSFLKKIHVKNAQASNIMGALVPFGKYVKNPCNERILLIGDAAGLVDPITGEGLYFAFLSAQYAYKAIYSSIVGKHSLCKSYTRDVIRIQKKIHDANIFNYFFNDFTRPYLLKIIKGKYNITQYVCDNLISEYNYSYCGFAFHYFKARRLRKRYEEKE